MLEIATAGAGVLAAAGCCAAPSRRRSRALAIVMALACLPLGAAWGVVAGALLLAVSVGGAVGLRTRPAVELGMDVHRAVAGVLMAGMLLAGGHGDAAAGSAHSHDIPLHALLGLAVLAHVAWTAWMLVVPHHPITRAQRLELIAMAAMFAASVAAMLLPS